MRAEERMKLMLTPNPMMARAKKHTEGIKTPLRGEPELSPAQASKSFRPLVGLLASGQIPHDEELLRLAGKVLENDYRLYQKEPAEG